MCLSGGGGVLPTLPSCGKWTSCIWEFPFAGSRMCREPAGLPMEQGGDASCHNFDAEKWASRAVYRQAQHIETPRRPQNLSVSVAGVTIGRPNQVGRRRHHLHSDGAAASSICAP